MKKVSLTIVALILTAGLCRAGVIVTTDNPYATAFTNGRHLARVGATNDLAAVGFNGAGIFFSQSADGGNTWLAAPEFVGGGYCPSIGLDINNYPNLCWINSIPGYPPGFIMPGRQPLGPTQC
jgi:hypothetical protein